MPKNFNDPPQGADRNNRRMVSISQHAYERLLQLRERLVMEIEANPSNYGGFAGRRITLSDVILLMISKVEA
jgi:hypothetical protein